MNASSKYPEPFQIIKRAQERYPGGEVLDLDRFDEEIDDILGAVGLLPSEDPAEELFLELTNPHVQLNRRSKVEIDNEFLEEEIACENPIPRRRGRPRKIKKLEFSDRFITNNLDRLIRDLIRVSQHTKPLHSSYCRGAVRVLLNESIHQHCSELLKRKSALRAGDVVGHLQRTRFRPADHQLIRNLIDKFLILELCRRTVRFGFPKAGNAKKLPTSMAWRRTVLLECEELFRRYAPPLQKNWGAVPPRLKTGTRSYFIQFVCAVLEPHVRPRAADPDVVNRQWAQINELTTAK